MADFSFDHQQLGEWASEIFSPITDLGQLFEISCDSMNMHQAGVEKIEDLFSNLSNIELCSGHEQPALPPPTTEVIWTTETGESSRAHAHQWNAILHSHQVSNQQIEWEEERNLKVFDLSQRVTDLADSEEEEGKQDHDDQQKTRRKKRTNEAHNIAEKKRRDRFAKKIRALQEFVPNCNKSDIASVLEDAAKYGKSLQQQFQIMYMHQSMQAQYYSPFVPMIRAMMGMGHELGMMYSSGYPANFQTVPTLGLNSLGYQFGFQPAVSQSQFPFTERR